MNGQGDSGSSRNLSFMGRSVVGESGKNIDVAFGDDYVGDALGDHVNSGSVLGDNHQDDGKKTKCQGHSPQQIQELQEFFKKCPYPNQKQRMELGKRLHLSANHVQCWFQNRRTLDKQKLKKENAKLREEIQEILSTVMQFPPDLCETQQPPSTSLVTSNPGGDAPHGCETLKKMTETSDHVVSPSMVHNFSELRISSTRINEPQEVVVSGGQPSTMKEMSTLTTFNAGRINAPQELVSGGETSLIDSLLDVAKLAMKELATLAEPESPFWVVDPNSRRESLNYEEYRRVYNNSIQPHGGYAMEATRETGLVLKDCLALVKTFTEARRWINVFGSIVSKANAYKLIPSRIRNGSFNLIEAEFQVISPLVPIRTVHFVRYCERIRKGLWMVVDVTTPQRIAYPLSYGCASRLPSGLLIEDMKNGYSKVTWIEQAEYDESHIHQTYRLMIGNGLGFGAKRWLTTLQRHYESLSAFASINMAEVYQGRLTSESGTEMLRLAQRMTLSFYSAVSGSSFRNWKRVYSRVENEHENMRFMVRKSKNEPGERTGTVLSVATSVWVRENQHTLFGFLSNRILRTQWDISTSNTFMVDTKINIRKSNSRSNNISLLQLNEYGIPMQVLQETWCDESGALLVYSPVNTDSVEKVMRGEEDADSVLILPSGFSISSDGTSGGEGCLLTLGLQLMLSSNPDEEVKQNDFEFAVELIMDTIIRKIKSGLPA